MTKFRQIINALSQGASISWGLDGYSSPEPTDRLMEICEVTDEARVGFHIGVYLARAIHFDDLKITFIQDNGYLKIYY